MKERFMRGLTLGCWIALVLLTVASRCAGQELSQQRRAIATIVTKTGNAVGFCSAVCVSPAGDVLTVGHCRPSRESVVALDGRTYTVEAVGRALPGLIDGPIWLQLAGDGPFPYAPVALAPPATGERVHAIGYPAREFAYAEGSIRRVASQADSRGRRQQFLETTFRVHEGHSGGPLFNAAGEVVGLASSRSPHPGERGYRGEPPAARWVHTSDLHAALLPTAAKRNRTLYVFSASWCAACKNVKRKEAALRRAWKPYGDVVVLEHGTKAFAAAQARCEAATSTKLTAIPAFWVEDTKLVEQDYRKFGGAEFNVLAVIRWAVKAIAELLIGRIRDRHETPPESVPESSSPGVVPQPSPTPAPPAREPDFEGVRVVITVPASEGYDRAKHAVLSLSVGRIERRLAHATDGKAGLVIVAERANAAAYNAVLQAAGLHDGLHVLVLVPKTSQGLVRGLIVSKIETAAVGRLKGLPIDVVFERHHAANYAAIVAALSVVPAAAAGDGGSSPLELLLHGVGGGGLAFGLLAALAALWRRRKATAAAPSELPRPTPTPPGPGPPDGG